MGADLSASNDGLVPICSACLDSDLELSKRQVNGSPYLGSPGTQVHTCHEGFRAQLLREP